MKKVAEIVELLEVSDSNVVLKTAYPDKFFMVFVSPSMHMLAYVKIGYNHFLQSPSKLTITFTLYSQ
jgi:hypothetical protein